MANRAVIVAGGVFSPESIQKLCRPINGDVPFVIGCDRGAEYLITSGITPHLVVGDFDSIDAEIHASILTQKIPLQSFEVEKDISDLEIAVQAAVSRGYTDIVIICALGNRADFTLTNCALLLNRQWQAVTIKIVEDLEEVYPLFEGTEFIIEDTHDSTFSIVPYALQNSLSIAGAKWELQRKEIALGDSLSLSNIAVGNELRVTFDRGYGLLIVHNSAAPTR